MTFLGIDLSPGMFALLIVALLVWDAYAIYRAVKVDKKSDEDELNRLDKMEELADEIKKQAAAPKGSAVLPNEAEKLSEPCKIIIFRPNFVSNKVASNSVPVSVGLNGNRIGSIKIGESVAVTTSLKENKLACNNNWVDPINYQAEPGDEVKFIVTGNEQVGFKFGMRVLRK